MSTSDQTVPVSTRHPIAIYFFFWGEFAERCSYYGMRAILPLYLSQSIHLSDADTNSTYYRFKMACYFLPLLGGYLADRYFGKYWTIVGFSVPYVLGHFIIGIPNYPFVILALALLAGGSGVIKPNISTLMGQTYDAQRPGQHSLRTAAFLWFYFAINFGALISLLAVPIIRNHFDYATAFQFPAWLMVFALIIFAAGKRFYALDVIKAPVPLSPEERKIRYLAMKQLFLFFGLMIFFWVVYEHNDTIWIFFMRDYVDLRLPWGSEPIEPDQLQWINALCVLTFAPLFGWAYGKFDPAGTVITAPRKIFCGFMFMVLTELLLTAAAYLTHGGESHVSIIWMIVAYIFLTIGEVLIYGTGLELAYAAAPANLKGFITGCFLLTNTLGNFVNSGIGGIGFANLYGGSLKDSIEERGPLSPVAFFGVSTLVVLVATVACYFLPKQIHEETPVTVRDNA